MAYASEYFQSAVPDLLQRMKYLMDGNEPENERPEIEIPRSKWQVDEVVTVEIHQAPKIDTWREGSYWREHREW